MTDISTSIRAQIDCIPLIDTHEHLMSEKARLAQEIDLFYWFSHYASSDLVSAGMPQRTVEKLGDTTRPLDDRWAEFACYWEHVRTTGYARALLLAARDLFGINDINEKTYQQLSEKLGASNHSGWYRYVLKERANIDRAMVVPIENMDPTPLEELDREFFVPVLRIDDFVTPCDRLDLEALGSKAGVAIHCLDDLLESIDVLLNRALSGGVVALKLGLAYCRSLHFERFAMADAERIFNQLGRYPRSIGSVVQPSPVSWRQAKPLQDYLMHYIVRRAAHLQLPIQIHTGLQEGNANFLANSHPLNLVNLLTEYPEAHFDLLHSGYPYQGEMVTLGKNFPNVCVDLCWLHVISPWVARQTLHELIETVPANKIFAFGGDYVFVEGAYAHSQMARANVADVLTEKIEAGYLDEDEAIALAHKLLRENARSFFNLCDST